MESVWYYARDGAQQGPMTFDDLKLAAVSGRLRPEDLVWKDGLPEWVSGKSIDGLFTTLAVPPLPGTQPPPPRIAPPVRHAAPIHDSPLRAKGPPPTGKEIVDLAKLFLQRATNPNPNAIVPTPDEEQRLVQAGYDPVAQKYAAWRRAVLWVSVLPTAFAALFGAINVINMDKDGFSGFGSTLLFVQALSVFALPITAVLAALSYDRLTKSAQMVLLGGVVALAIPLMVAFTPADLVLDLRAGREAVAALAAVLGIQFYILLMPMVLSLLPGVSRGSARVKMFLPESLVPGWGMVASIPLFVLLTLVTFIVVYHVAGNTLLFIALILLIGSPLIYLTKFKLLTRPLTDPQDIQALAKTQLLVLIAIGVGVVLLIIYLFTARVGNQTILGFDRDKTLVRPWSLNLHSIWIEYIGRSLFMTVLFADLLVKMAVMVWREERAFSGTPAAQNFDRTMSGLGAAIETKGMPPVG